MRLVDSTLQAALMRREHAARPANSIIHMLSRMHKHYEAQGQTMRDTLLSRYQDKLAHNTTQTKANLRRAVAECTVEIKAQTEPRQRYQQLQKDMTGKSQKAEAKAEMQPTHKGLTQERGLDLLAN